MRYQGGGVWVLGFLMLCGSDTSVHARLPDEALMWRTRNDSMGYVPCSARGDAALDVACISHGLFGHGCGGEHSIA